MDTPAPSHYLHGNLICWLSLESVRNSGQGGSSLKPMA